MTREQQLEKELAEIRKARTTLVDKLEDAGKLPAEKKAAIFDDLLILARAATHRIINGEEGPEHDSFSPIVQKFLVEVIGQNVRELLQKVQK